MASFTIPCPKSSSLSGRGLASHHRRQQPRQSKISYNLALISRPSALVAGSSPDDSAAFGFRQPNQKGSAVWKVHALPAEVVAEKSSNSAPLLDTVASSQGKGESAEKTSVQNSIPDPTSITEFMAQVSDLVKLVDSRDIMELQLKQRDCELIIRKKEALPQPVPAASAIIMQPPMAHPVFPSQPQPTQATAPAPASPASSAPPPALPAPAKASKSSHPPLKCPMAGTFYRSPAPGEPPFVKVGDKVQKGQILCIVEAMKLMNEIEADQSGTIAEILLDDGKPVSVDTPLFVIIP
ncbi:biotin carboxyl carrier protein of acetyl-CoA carboxylase 2, chloroplastic [Malania oleifera]|uniref:biotin carboxyl carrier protein of acetyl-CoA carboxylase 2, chloroplastic n=1 Tax=Malania oleifera TaxID=397392 RepID=UPI0025ADE896|nr:biotin carboxyl carrier protein of acetyl-CoA carboxylase 2, chloroplastic [Malania oleifera]